MRKTRAACATFAAACVFALLAACGTGPAQPAAPRAHGHYPAQGATSPEELVYYSSIVARVRLIHASASIRPYPADGGARFRSVFKFRFSVMEYLKGDGGGELTVMAIPESVSPYSFGNVLEAYPSEAWRKAQAELAERDARWDDREAIVFLRPSRLEDESGVYQFTNRDAWSPAGLYGYSIASEYNRAWLPAAAPSDWDAAANGAPDSPSSRDPRYFASAPDAQPADAANPDADVWRSATYISLSDIKALVAANEDRLAKNKNVPGYEDCIKDKFRFDALYERYPPEMNFIERRVPSGQPAGYALYPAPSAAARGDYYAKRWFAGPDSDLFAFRIINDPDSDPSTGYNWEGVILRPMPAGEYKAFYNSQPPAWAPCDYYPEAVSDKNELTIIATAPDGVVHESFFDPADMGGGAVGAKASNGATGGALSPADFAFGGANVSIDSILWQSRTVQMRLSPHTRLANHRADFIALDGSIALRLDFDDAVETGDGESRALSWTVLAQPWQAGDTLMLRVSESAPDLTGAALDADFAAASAPNSHSP